MVEHIHGETNVTTLNVEAVPIPIRNLIYATIVGVVSPVIGEERSNVIPFAWGFWVGVINDANLILAYRCFLDCIHG